MELLNVKIIYQGGIYGMEQTEKYKGKIPLIEIKQTNGIVNTFYVTNILEENLQNFSFSTLNKIIEGKIIELLIDKNSIYMPSTRLFLPSFYKYIYTIEKDGDEFLCYVNDIEINRVKNEFVFVNFDRQKEECFKK